MTARFIVGDVFDGLASLEDGSIDLVVTSPPFLALRSYLPDTIGIDLDERNAKLARERVGPMFFEELDLTPQGET